MPVLPPVGAQLVARNRVHDPGTADGFFGAETVLGGHDLKSHHDDRSSSLYQCERRRSCEWWRRVLQPAVPWSLLPLVV